MLNLERQLAAPPGRGVLAGVAKHAGQLALIATAPVTFALPAGFHLFWLSSTALHGDVGRRARLLDTPPPVILRRRSRRQRRRRRRDRGGGARAKAPFLVKYVRRCMCCASGVRTSAEAFDARRRAFSLGLRKSWCCPQIDGAASSRIAFSARTSP